MRCVVIAQRPGELLLNHLNNGTIPNKRKAKIIGTIGPASSSIIMLERLISAGLNVARINMGHGTHQDQQKLIKNIRRAANKVGREVGILMDLQGPKVRVGTLPSPLKLSKGEEWFIGLEKHRGKYRNNFIPTDYERLMDDCCDNTRILFNDGLIVARTLERLGNVYKIEIEVGGELKSRKGINMPDCHISAPSLTRRDKENLIFGLKQDVDFFALSFVKNRSDVEEIKFFLHKLKKHNPIIAKIETPQGIENLEDIIDIADMIMVARGDLGVELGNHQVPRAQKSMIEFCNQYQKPVITATQMLESMTENSTPTRAEASDIANAIWDGTDAVMLSAETASGKYPWESVVMMGKIIEEAEKSPKERPFLRNIDLSSINASMMVAASLVAEKVDAKRIIAVTESGHSCQKMSIFRPQTDVLGVALNIEAARKLTLCWGVTPYYFKDHDIEEMDFPTIIEKVKGRLNLQNGDKLVVTSGDGKFFTHGTANSIKVEIVKNCQSAPGSSDVLEEAADEQKRILLDTSVCASCQNCVRICPHDIWAVTKDQDKKTYIAKDKIHACTMDMECIQVCPTGAIEIISTP